MAFAAVFAIAATLQAVAAPSDGSDAARRQFLWSSDGSALNAVVPAALPGSRPGMPVAADPGGPAGADGPILWEQMNCPPNVYIRAISMATPQVGFVAAELGIVLRTVDGGDTWQSVLSQGFPYYYYGVHAFSADTVLITGFNNQTGEGILRWSDDGGDSWGPITVLDAPTFFDWLSFVEFADDNRGVIQGWGGGTFYTTTGGRTASDWHFTQPTDNWWAGTFTFLPDGRVWMTGYDNFRSNDGGASWERIADADPLFDGPNAILASGIGFIGGGTISPTVSGWAYKTTDGGDSWTPSPVLTTTYPVRTFHQLDDQRAWAAGGNVLSGVGGIWGTEDGGATWALERNTNAEITDMTMVRVGSSEADVYAVGMVSQIWRARVTISEGVPGDLNCDGAVDGADIDPFFLALGFPDDYSSQYPDCNRLLADMNGDDAVDGADIDPFFDCLGNGNCP